MSSDQFLEQPFSTSKNRIFTSQKGNISSQRKFERFEGEKKAVFIIFTALLPQSNILPPQKIDNLFIRILLSHKGKDDRENALIRFLTMLAQEESSEIFTDDPDTFRNRVEIYKNIAQIAKTCVDENQDYSKAALVVDMVVIMCRLSKQPLPKGLEAYFEKAALFFLEKQESILQYVTNRKMVHPSIIRRSVEYAKLALEIADHYSGFSSDEKLHAELKKAHAHLQELGYEWGRQKKSGQALA